jgi:chaperonin GroEL
MIYTNDETRTNVTEGAKILYEIVKSTLGPKGRNVLVKNKFGEFKVTHDGVSVAKAVQLGDDPRSVGVDLLRDAALKMEEIGDGTTSVTVLGYNLIVELNKLIDKGENPMQLKRKLEAMVEPLIAEVDKLAKPIGKTKQALYDVALISVGGDEELAKVITEVMIAAGIDSLISVEQSNLQKTTGSVAEGYTFDSGFLSPYMITEKSTRSAVLNDPAIVYVAGDITRVEQMASLFEGVAQAGFREILFVVERIEEEPLDMVVYNNVKQVIKATVVKAPGTDDIRERLLDMASLTGGGVIDTAIDGWEEYLVANNFGRAKRVVVKAHDTLIMADAGGDTAERIKLIKGLDKKESDDVAKAKYAQRLAALTNGVGVIKVGGINDSDANERKDRVDDAIGAIHAAMKGGIVAGGGVTLRDIASHLSGKEFEIAIFDALNANEKVLLENSGYSLNQLEGYEGGKIAEGHGIDVATGDFVQMMNAGIVDPAIVTKEVIRNAFAAAALAITVGGSIIDKKLSQEELMQLMGAKG